MPSVPQDLTDWMRRIEDQLREVAGRSQTRPAAGQSVSGDVVVGGTRALRVLLASGVGDQFLIGQDGGSRVARFYRADGTIAFSAVAQTTLWDLTGAAVVADDAAGGLARPYLPYVAAPARTADWLATTNAAFEDVWRMSPFKLNPAATITLGHIADAATAGEVRVTVAGSPVGSTITVGTTQTATTVGPLALAGAQESVLDIRVQARRTSGTGSVRCAVIAASGFHS